MIWIEMMNLLLVTLLFLSTNISEIKSDKFDEDSNQPVSDSNKNDRIPHLFIFKKSNDSKVSSKKRRKKNAEFILIDTVYRNDHVKDMKYDPMVSENFISSTPSPEELSVQSETPPSRRSVHPTQSPHYSSTVSYQFTTTDGLGYVHVEIGKGAATASPIAKFPNLNPLTNTFKHSQEKSKNIGIASVTVKSMPRFPEQHNLTPNPE